ncbi:MAG TPA: hypothetical protein VEP90_04140 [Methylomirabilota bacterium]|nr:hypothetical protein [Methylomirabilota bacterium]
MALDYLKVKIYSLAEEAKYIRKQEQKRKRKAAYARDHVHYDRRVAWHIKQIARLQHRKIVEYSADVTDIQKWKESHKHDAIDYDERIQWHKMEILRLQRQHNTTHITQETVNYNERIRGGLRLHRIWDVRSEARATYVAYAFLRGLEYEDVEPASQSSPQWGRVRDLVQKYGERGTYQDRLEKLAEWVNKTGASQGTVAMVSCPTGTPYEKVTEKRKQMFPEATKVKDAASS